jgi:cytochrome c peroxidase
MLGLLRHIAVPALALFVAGCNPNNFSEEEKKTIASLSLAALPPLPADPTNRVADDRRAAAFGATLFFDTDFSANGAVACGTCHLIDRQFQDGLALARGVGTTDRRTMPLAGVAYSPWQFWDGRKDSLWAQALGPMEDAREHGGNRTFYSHLVAEKYRDRYEGIFGPLPELAGTPQHAGPKGNETEQAAWQAMPGDQREEIDTVFSNLGKAIAAFERSIQHPETRFDRFAAALAAGKEPEGDAAFSDLETEGLRLFIGKAQCVTCHNGPRFTDDHFHNTGVPAVPNLPEDRGRAQAVAQVLSDPFNCEGKFSDAPDKCDELRFMIREGEELERAFKTPSLRGAASRPPYMHSGQIVTLEDVIDHYSRAPESPAGHSEIDPIVFTERGRAALIAFLRTLE